MKITNIEDLDITINPVGEVASPWDDGRRADKWAVVINGQGFTPWKLDYFTGLGCRPETPTKSDVLHSLLMDADAGLSTFKDWCADFGYNDDSIKALETYKACVRTYQDLILQVGLDGMEDLKTLLEDY